MIFVRNIFHNTVALSKWSILLVLFLCFFPLQAEQSLPAQTQQTVVPGQQKRIDWIKRRNELGHQNKFRVLVDKVLSASNAWIMTEKHMDEIHAAGFNVIVPRIGCDDMKRVRRVAQMARKRGMFYMAWMRGTLTAESGVQLVWRNGASQNLYSPNADELWNWMTDLILGHVRLSVENPAIIGSFLDFENYAAGRQGNCYELSYDTKILTEFVSVMNLNLPELKPADRYSWLENNNLHERFQQFQVDSWRERCRRLRQKIDAINPRFQLIVYPRGPLFLNEAIYPEWATEQAPLIIADHSTYGRPKQVPQAEALKLNRQLLLHGLKEVQNKKMPILYMGGIDPIVRGADPEFCGKNANLISQLTDGYWIFYEGPNYHKPDHAAYFKWFSTANQDIIAHKYSLWQEPRREPKPAIVAHERVYRRYCGDTARCFSTKPLPEEARKIACTVRGRADFAVLLKAGEILRGKLQVRALGSYISGTNLGLYGPDRSLLEMKKAEIFQPVQLNYQAPKEGVYVISLETGKNAAQLFVNNQYFCLIAEPKVGFLGPQPALYFLTKPDASQASLTLSSPSPEETALLTVIDPTGSQAAQVNTIKNETIQSRLTFDPALSTKPWSLSLSNAHAGAFEDYSIVLGPGCYKFLATNPNRLLISTKQQ